MRGLEVADPPWSKAQKPSLTLAIIVIVGRFLNWKSPRYYMTRPSVPVQSIPYTSKSVHRTSVIGKRNGDWFNGFDGYGCNADWKASQTISQWLGFSCPLDLLNIVVAMAMADAKGVVDGSPLPK